MTTSKTSCTEYDAVTRNQFIGAMCATGELTKSANLVGMEKSAASCLWKKAQKMGTTKNLPCPGHPSKLSDWAKWAIICDSINHRRKPFQEIAHQAADNVGESTFWRDTTRGLPGRSHSLPRLGNREGWSGQRNLNVLTRKSGWI